MEKAAALADEYERDYEWNTTWKPQALEAFKGMLAENKSITSRTASYNAYKALIGKSGMAKDPEFNAFVESPEFGKAIGEITAWERVQNSVTGQHLASIRRLDRDGLLDMAKLRELEVLLPLKSGKFVADTLKTYAEINKIKKDMEKVASGDDSGFSPEKLVQELRLGSTSAQARLSDIETELKAPGLSQAAIEALKSRKNVAT